MFKRLSLLSLIALMLLAVALAAGCAAEPQTATEEPAQTTPEVTEPAAEPETSEEPATTSDAPAEFPEELAKDVTKLKTEDLKVGDGEEAKEGSLATVHYTGWLTDGTKFDSSLDSGQPFQFKIGEGKVIPGWETGVAGMKEGGTRVLVIPPDQGYGAQGAGGVIPPNATLVFEVRLVSVD